MVTRHKITLTDGTVFFIDVWPSEGQAIFMDPQRGKTGSTDFPIVAKAGFPKALIQDRIKADQFFRRVCRMIKDFYQFQHKGYAMDMQLEEGATLTEAELKKGVHLKRASQENIAALRDRLKE